jgi:hypothetical protein
MPSASTFRKQNRFYPANRALVRGRAQLAIQTCAAFTYQRIRYHFYSHVRVGKVVIVAFWHASRGSGPSV